MISLDERLAEARSALDALAVPPVPPFDVRSVRTARPRRSTRIALVAVAAAAAVTAVAVVVHTDDTRSITSIGTDSESTQSSPPADTEPATTNSTVDITAPTQPPTTAETSTTLDVSTTIPPSDGVAEVTPIPFGANGLQFIPGAWGDGTTYTAAADGVHVDADPWHAVLSDIGPSVSNGDDATFDATFTDAPRLGPLGPAVTVTADGTSTTATSTISGRLVSVSGIANQGALIDLLRSVTTTSQVQPVRPTSATAIIPDVVGVDYRVATQRLEESGIRVVWELNATTTPSSSLPIGTVTATTPSSGATAAVGSQVVLHVVNGLVSRRPQFNTFQRAATPPDKPFDGVRDVFGFFSGFGALPDSAPLRQEENVSAPVVFLHGELVGRFREYYDGAHSASALLTDEVDPDWSAVEFLPEPAQTQVPIVLTQAVDFGGLHFGLPADWTIDTNGSCPQTRTLVIVTASTADCVTPADPWITVSTAAPGLTPCIAGFDDHSVPICSLDIPDYRTSATIVSGTNVEITTAGASVSDGAEINAIRNSLTGGTPAASTSTFGAILPGMAAVQALLAGDCTTLSAMTAPTSALNTDCSTITPQTVGPTDLGGGQTRPTLDPEDLTHDAAIISYHGNDPDHGWYIETQTFYDSTLRRSGSMIVELTDPTGVQLIAPAPTNPSKNTTLPSEPLWPGTNGPTVTNSSVVTNASLPGQP